MHQQFLNSVFHHGEWRLPTTTDHSALLDSNGSDADFRKMIYGIFTMSVNFDRIRDCMAAALGLSGIQYHILMVVAELCAEGPVTISIVAERLHTSGAYVTMETKKLMRRGFLDKQRNPDDGRSVIITLTNEGRAAVDDFAPYNREINGELFEEGVAQHQERVASAADEADESKANWALGGSDHMAILRAYSAWDALRGELENASARGWLC